MPDIVSFKANGRTGNNIFQYLACKVIEHLYGHKYVAFEKLTDVEHVISHYIYDNTYSEFIAKPRDYIPHILICDGYFQKSEYFIPHRHSLISMIMKTNEKEEYWTNIHGNRETLMQYINPQNTHSIVDLTENDVVINLRLDDFIQLPNPTSDIIPPQYYLDILENKEFNRLYIVCDRIRQDWEYRYLEFFQKWGAVLIQNTLEHDCALLRDAPILIHSNSTLCWIISFFSETKRERYIPKTFHYAGQDLNEIDKSTDRLFHVKTLSHHEVFYLNKQSFLLKHIFPLSYGIPDELIMDDETADTCIRHDLFAFYISNENKQYVFSASQEKEYYQMYQNSKYAYTQKKGGWDCLRHYEILASGCIPIFKDLEHCPKDTMVSFPKEMVMELNKNMVGGENPEKRRQLLEYTRTNCSTSAMAKYFIDTLNSANGWEAGGIPRKVLLIRGNIGVNYTRELLYIGLKRYIQETHGHDAVAVEFPKIKYLYETFPEEEKENLYGNGFSYTRRLKDDFIDASAGEIVEKINAKYWDLIIYGKVGPDEGVEGSLPHMPLWEHVFKKYGRNQIVFLYGGDECIDMTHDNRYSQHIYHHSQYANCFVRELRK